MSRVILSGCALEGRAGHDAGRALLASAYRQWTGQDLPPIALTPQGKPYFPDSPLHFSITHTPRHAFCALSDAPVGIDAEETDRNISLKLAERILSPAEKARFDAAPDPRAALLRLWVLKEAAVKLSGEGLRGYPNHTDFSPDDPRITERDCCYVAVLTQEEHHAL